MTKQTKINTNLPILISSGKANPTRRKPGPGRDQGMESRDGKGNSLFIGGDDADLNFDLGSDASTSSDNADDEDPTPTLIGTQQVLELTLEVDVGRAIERTITEVSRLPLRRFLQGVLSETGVHLHVIEKVRPPAGANPKGDFIAPQPYIVRLRRAGEVARFWSELGAHDRDVLYVATVLRGIQQLLGRSIHYGNLTPNGLTHSIVLKHLRVLDGESERCSYLLRLAMGWANEDEIDEATRDKLVTAMERALRAVGMLPPVQTKRQPVFH